MKANRLPMITLLTDFGHVDHYVGVMKGVLLGICPEAQIVDISHEVTPYGIAEGAFTLGQSWTYFPAGTIHVAVVDPGVGSARRPIVVEAGGHFFVGPDNGIFDFVYSAEPGCRVREVTASQYFLRPVSRTFHGRDIFSPVAAHLANGTPIGEFGPRISDPVRLGLAEPEQTASGTWTGRILKTDRFGNIVTNFRSHQWEHLRNVQFIMSVGRSEVNTFVRNYMEASSNSLVVVLGSAGYLEVSVNGGDAAKVAGCRTGDRVVLNIINYLDSGD